MDCPVCRDVKLAMTDRQGIEIDYCPQCRGVWLDRGELDKLIERASLDAPSRTAPPPLPPRQDHGREAPRYSASDPYRQKKKKNLLDELFDF
ncbi:zf-TFIIB domain-containing protein [Lysobacter sp. LF1]|uniref:Zf-TFIIB domain-containing protein n=1 Tax=Lysobacter stagni TaxID=3045172 RepID=A0ABT6XGD1_9GAMM|nr:zf-TFIIB domain-containing protein [Lysobacter sp. LF1]MDI9239202.1 zf-TFIIB domain-containing protein [Lysobacter sp. LF1]